MCAIFIQEASDDVTEQLVDIWCRGANIADRQILVRLTRGYPKFTQLVCDSWIKNRSIVAAKASDIVYQFLIGESNPSIHESPTIKTARLVATCGGIHDWETRDISGLLETLESSLTATQFRESVSNLIRRGVVKQYGPDITIEPKVLALKLAELQWKIWSVEQYENVLLGNLDIKLKESSCRQLSLMNDTTVATEIVQSIFGIGGVFRLQSSYQLFEQHQSLLPWLVQIDRTSVVDVVSDYVQQQMAAGRIPVFDHVMQTLRRAAYSSESYETSASTLFKIAAYSNDEWATVALKEVHSLLGTAANSTMRLQLLESQLNDNSPRIRFVLHRILDSIILDHGSTRAIGPEKHGIREAIESWRPKTDTEYLRYLTGVARLLLKLAETHDKVGEDALATLGESITRLLRLGAFEFVEDLIDEVRPRLKGCWPNAIRSMRSELEFRSNSMSEQTINASRRLYEKLLPTTPEDKVDHFLRGVLLDRSKMLRLEVDEQKQRVAREIAGLVADVLAREGLLTQQITRLCESNVPEIGIFGQKLAKTLVEPLNWLKRIKVTVCETPPEQRSIGFLLGYLKGLQESHPLEVRRFKHESVSSHALASLVPKLCLALGIELEDIQLVIDSMERGYLEPRLLSCWSMQGVLDRVGSNELLELLNHLADTGPEGYVVAVEIPSLNLSQLQAATNNLRGLPELIVKIVRLVDKWPSVCNDMFGYYFSKVVKGVLDKGHRDNDARRLATLLATKVLALMKHHSTHNIEDLVRKVFKDFPEIALAAIKQELNDSGYSTLIEYEVADQLPTRKDEPLITLFPIELLLDWCYEDESIAPRFLGTTLPFLTDVNVAEEHRLNPSMQELIDQFGKCDSLWEGIRTNLRRFVWVGDMAPYFMRYIGAIDKLIEHPNAIVRTHARVLRAEILGEARMAKRDDDQRRGRMQF